jgi:hypothetical protein
VGNKRDVRGIAGLFSGSTCTAASDHRTSISDNNYLVQVTGMSLSPLEVVDRHAIDTSRLFACSHPYRGVWRDDLTGICYERDYSCIPVGYPDTADGTDTADYSSAGVFQALTPDP